MLHSQPLAVSQGFGPRDCFLMNAAVSKVHLACCLGRMDSSDYRPWVSMNILVSFTECEWQFLVYISTVQRSRHHMWCESMLRLEGFRLMATRVSMISENARHAFHTVWFSNRNSADTMSQPVIAWKKGGGVWQCSGLAIARCDELGCLWMFSMIWSLSKVLQGSFPGRSSRPAPRVTVYCPQVGLCMTCNAAWRRWSIIRVSAFSFLHGDKTVRSVDLLLSTVSPLLWGGDKIKQLHFSAIPDW